jgi:hypothetical protein
MPRMERTRFSKVRPLAFAGGALAIRRLGDVLAGDFVGRLRFLAMPMV